MFLDRSAAHRHQLMSKIEQQTARTTERQMEIQHRLHKPEQNDAHYDGRIDSLGLNYLTLTLRSLLAGGVHALSLGKRLQSPSLSILSSHR